MPKVHANICLDYDVFVTARRERISISYIANKALKAEFRKLGLDAAAKEEGDGVHDASGRQTS